MTGAMIKPASLVVGLLGCVALGSQACSLHAPRDVSASPGPRPEAPAALVAPEPPAGAPEPPAASAPEPEMAASGEAAGLPTGFQEHAVFPENPFTLTGERERVIEVYPPSSTRGRKPMVVFLHATCMQPRPVCDAFGSAGRDTGWLVCPAGNSACYGEPDWSGSGPTKAAFLAHAMAQAQAQIEPFVEEKRGVLVGWSRGAFAARDILDASVNSQPPGPLAQRFSGLVLIAASVPLDPKKLRAAGISRVVLAAGDHDGARASMASTDASLRAAGLESRYISLGKIGHQWPNDFEARMSEPISWASGKP